MPSSRLTAAGVALRPVPAPPSTRTLRIRSGADFAEIVLNSINEANPNEPTEEPVPYTGGQFVRIPEFQELGNDVTQIFASALVGDIEIDAAIEEANDLANQVAIDAGYQE